MKLDKEQSKSILMCQLISPLISTIHNLDKRTNYLKQQFNELEDEYKKRLTPLEKYSYKTDFQDEEYNWQQIISSVEKHGNEKIEKISFNEASRYFFNQNSKNFSLKGSFFILHEKILNLPHL